MSVIFSQGVLAVEPDMVLMAPMPDGVELSTAVHLPDPGVFPPPYPTVLMRTPYPDVLGALDPAIADMVIHYMVDLFGLALVIQDTRGTGGSGGDPDAFFSDWKDGPETVDWLVSQDWCDGQVLQFGLSALAIPGYLAAPNASDSLKCQFLGEAAPDMYNLAAFHGGVFKKDTVESWLSWVGASSMLASLSDHRDCDEFWDPLMIDRIPGEIHTAAMHIGGWYDVFTEGIIAGYRTYVERGDEWASKHQYLVLGPWDHWTLANSLGETSSFGYAMQADLIAWTTFCVAGDTSQVPGWPHVRYYVMGSTEDGAPGNEWRTSPDWPLPAEYRSFEIHADGILGDRDEIGSGDIGDAASEPDAGDADVSGGEVLPAAVPFDHTSSSPVVGGRNLTGSSGRLELARVLARSDYVMFATEALDEPFESIGRMSAVFDVSTRWADADVVVRLVDVYPDGSVWLLSDGAARLSRRGSCAAAVEVEPDHVYQIEVDLLTSAMVFNTGHKLAVIVTATMYPKYELNPSLEAESRANGPIADAFVIHGGRLLMPVSSPIVEVPEVVELSDAAGQAEVTDVVVVVDAPADAALSDVVEVGPADAALEVVADADADAAVASDTEFDALNVDVRDAALADQATTDLVDLDSSSEDDNDVIHRVGGGCSSSGTGPSGMPAAIVLFMLAAAGIRLRRAFR